MALIEVEKLSKYYRMGESIVHALDGVDLTIEKGEFIAITGASGSGKSTMMHLLGCLDRPSSGVYRLNGRDVSDMSERELAAIRNKYIGFVFQTFNLINRTNALDNVSVPIFYARKLNARDPARRALERVGLLGRAKHTPAELSGGERQRVAIARAIVNDPLLLLADEPTGNLDTRTGVQIMQIFHDLNEQGVTIILVTHEPDIAEQAKRIVQMRDGRIVSDQPGPNRRPALTDGRTTLSLHAPSSAVAPLAADGAPGAPAAVLARATDSDGNPMGSTAAEPAASGARQDAPQPQVEHMTPRKARGAGSALGCSVAACVLATAAIIAAYIAKSLYPELGSGKIGQPGQPLPPAPVLGLLAGSGFGVFGGIVLGIIGLVWGRSVLRTTRDEPARWVGLGKARAAIGLGLLGALGPCLVPIVTGLMRWVLARASG